MTSTLMNIRYLLSATVGEVIYFEGNASVVIDKRINIIYLFNGALQNATVAIINDFKRKELKMFTKRSKEITKEDISSSYQAALTAFAENKINDGTNLLTKIILNTKEEMREKALKCFYEIGKSYLLGIDTINLGISVKKDNEKAADYFYRAAAIKEEQSSNKNNKSNISISGLADANYFYGCLLMTGIRSQWDRKEAQRRAVHLYYRASEEDKKLAKLCFKFAAKHKKSLSSDLYEWINKILAQEVMLKEEKEEKSKRELYLELGINLLCQLSLLLEKENRRKVCARLYNLGKSLMEEEKGIKNKQFIADCLYGAAAKGEGIADGCYLYALYLEEGNRSQYDEMEKMEGIEKYYKWAKDKKRELFPAFLASLYDRGKGGERKPDKAFINFKKAADACDHPYSQYVVAKALFYGIGISSDHRQAWRYCQAAKKNNYHSKEFKELYDKLEKEMIGMTPPHSPPPKIKQDLTWSQDINILMPLLNLNQLMELDEYIIPFTDEMLEYLHFSGIRKMNSLEKNEMKSLEIEMKKPKQYPLKKEEKESMMAMRVKQLEAISSFDTAHIPFRNKAFSLIKEWSAGIESMNASIKKQEGIDIPYTILNFAVHKLDLAQIQFLIRQVGLDINAAGEGGKTALMTACQIENEKIGLEIIKFLIENGADLNLINEEGETALHCCASAKYARFLLKNKGILCLKVKNQLGYTPLEKVLFNFSEEKIKLLKVLLYYSEDEKISDILTTLAAAEKNENEKENLIKILNKGLNKSKLPLIALCNAVTHEKDTTLKLLINHYSSEIYKIYLLVVASSLGENKEKSLARVRGITEEMAEKEELYLLAARSLAQRLHGFVAQHDPLNISPYQGALIFLEEQCKLLQLKNSHLTYSEDLVDVIAKLLDIMKETYNKLSSTLEDFIKAEEKLTQEEKRQKQECDTLTKEISLLEKSMIEDNKKSETLNQELNQLKENEQKITQEFQAIVQELTKNLNKKGELDSKFSNLRKVQEAIQNNQKLLNQIQQEIFNKTNSKNQKTQEVILLQDKYQETSQKLFLLKEQLSQQLSKKEKLTFLIEKVNEFFKIFEEKVKNKMEHFYIMERAKVVKQGLEMHLEDNKEEMKRIPSELYGFNRGKNKINEINRNYFSQIISRRNMTIHSLHRFIDYEKENLKLVKEEVAKLETEYHSLLEESFKQVSDADLQQQWEELVKHKGDIDERSESESDTVSVSPPPSSQQGHRSREWNLSNLSTSSSFSSSPHHGFFKKEHSSDTEYEVKIKKRQLGEEKEASAYFELDVAGDGTCLFYSVAFGFLLPVITNKEAFQERFTQLFGKENIAPDATENLCKLLERYRGEPDFIKQHASELEVLVDINFRKQVVEYMRVNATDFSKYVEIDFNHYLQEMSNPKNWGDELVIQAISKILKCKIRVFREDQGELCPPSLYGEEFSISLYLVYTHIANSNNKNKNHYHYLIEERYLKIEDNKLLLSLSA